MPSKKESKRRIDAFICPNLEMQAAIYVCLLGLAREQVIERNGYLLVSWSPLASSYLQSTGAIASDVRSVKCVYACWYKKKGNLHPVS